MLACNRRILYINILVCLLVCFTIFRSTSWPISPSNLDIFLSTTICGRLIRHPNLALTTNESIQLEHQIQTYFSFPKDCSLYTSQKTISPEELTYPLAFTILVHTNLDQFDFLLKTIYRKSNHYCIHVDLEAPATLYEAIKNQSSCVTNIYLPKQRVNVTWGQFSVLEAEHLCQQELLKQSTTWKYYFNLANSDIPLKTNFELIQILKLYNNQNDVTSLPYTSYHRQNNRTLPSSLSLPFYKGEFHVLLTRSAVEYIHTNNRPIDLYNFLNGTNVPDEHYYSMINRWKETPGYYPHDHDLNQTSFMTRYKIWSDRPEQKLCRGGFHRTICIFNYQDIWHLARAPHLFANKVLFQKDRSAAYCMAQYLEVRNKMKQEGKEYSIIDENFYKQLQNVEFGNKKKLMK
ncbi:unnamed protein product [Adineta steineri]|uniref:Uncharacterized protein n=2 Tax=Adineta steineri TaxID=433720 RepID=A0A819Y802_9BILA|nr:unnamed protein product [Adineta steineri]CAF4153888.1 unnamed protein product [Adineta steineri]